MWKTNNNVSCFTSSSSSSSTKNTVTNVNNAIKQSTSSTSSSNNFKPLNMNSNRFTLIKDRMTTKGLSLPGLDITNYERVKIVGQGSFGIAVLYKRKIDNMYVVFKQINLTDLTYSEKELAMNEVDVFSKVHHPNIISYLGSFIKDNTLLIEMEYADGGTLAKIITERNNREYFPERYVISIFEQITSAINYLHSENIIHRDLKTANVFLNKRGSVKIGDFGISKIMNAQIHVQTVLGTPFYFSPEMCEGKEYDYKSDIWALGCILGEICCLHKSFAANNLSELVNKIMTGQYSPIPSGYSNGLKGLLGMLLQVEAPKRPDASEILKYWIPLLFRNLGKHKGYTYDSGINTPNNSLSSTTTIAERSTTRKLMEAETATPVQILQKRSILYQIKAFGTSFSLNPLQLPPKSKIRMVATSGSHFAVVNDDGSVYSWGEGSKGQLGLNTLDVWKHYPSRMESIRKYHVVGACAGDGFTILWTDFGVVMSCGESKTCLGHENEKISYTTPKIIEKLDNIKIEQITCGIEHVVAISNDGKIFTWGCSLAGALGLGNQSFVQPIPFQVTLPHTSSKPVKIFCGPDTSAFLLKNGVVYACGSNVYNKLGFSEKYSKIMTFKKILIDKKIIDLSMSSTHTAFLIEGGYVITIGKNSEGQRGAGHCNLINFPTLVTGIMHKHVKKVKCGNSYTVVFSDDNVVTFWGTRYGVPEVNLYSNNSNQNDKKNVHSSSSSSSLFQKINFKNQQVDLGNSTKAFTNFLASIYKSELILDPVDILALCSSREQLQKGHYVEISNIYPLSHSLLVLVDTTVPLVMSSQNY